MTQVTDLSIDNKLAHYVFNSGALTTDSSGNSRTLTNNNTVGETANGKYGYAADYGDSNSNKDFSRDEDIWNNGAISFAAWVKRANTTDTHSFFECQDTGTDKQLYLSAISSNQLRGRIFRVGVGYDSVSTSSITWDTNWHHVALTLATGAGGAMKIYFDGVEVGSGDVTNASGTTNQGELYRVGRSNDDGYTEGYMDDVLFTSDVLTPAEIASLAFTPTTTGSGFFYFM